MHDTAPFIPQRIHENMVYQLINVRRLPVFVTVCPNQLPDHVRPDRKDTADIEKRCKCIRREIRLKPRSPPVVRRPGARMAYAGERVVRNAVKCFQTAPVILVRIDKNDIILS